MHPQRRAPDAPRTAVLTTSASRRGSNQPTAVSDRAAVRCISDTVKRASPPNASTRQSTASSHHEKRNDDRTATTAENAVVKRKVDEILKRMLPHTIVQSYGKVSAALKTQIVVAVNGEELQVVEENQGSLGAQWRAQQDAAAAVKRKTAAPAHPFHYARSIQYATTHPGLSLNESFKTLEVTVTSLATGTTVHWLQSSSPVLTKKSWKLIVETDRKIGLALYELALGPWKASSIVVLVWAKTLEVVNIYLQLHIAELLYGCPPRAIRILADDVDPRYGLHSFTVAVTIRDFTRVLWETECYAVEFPTPDGSSEYVSIELLDGVNGYRDRGRFIATPVATAIATDAISVDLEAAIMVDVTVWEASCQPIWTCSKLLPLTTREAPREATDFSMSVAGDKRQLSEILMCDDARGNRLKFHVEKPSATSTVKNKSVFVQQITLELATAFVNKTFNTDYPIKPTRPHRPR